MTTWSGTLPTIAAGAKILGSDIDTIRDAVGGVTDAWTAYTPTWTSSGTAPALGNGTLTGSYIRSGKFVVATALLIMGSTTTYGTGSYRISLPAGLTSARNYQAGSLYMVDTGTAQKAGGVYTYTDGTNVELVASTAVVSSTVPHTWANGDYLSWAILMEVA